MMMISLGALEALAPEARSSIAGANVVHPHKQIRLCGFDLSRPLKDYSMGGDVIPANRCGCL